METSTRPPIEPEFLPMSRAEMETLGWDALDVLIVTGDAYVDHPTFGMALLGRWLSAHGYRVGIVAQPSWKTVEDVARLGRPRLFVGVTAGALDSMLAHYTAFKKPRSDDAYTPGGKHGARPNRATLVYAGLVRQAFPGLPVVIGGIEASLRRATHYDFWSDKLRRSIAIDSQAQVLACGMAENVVLEVARRLEQGKPLTGIPGTAWTSTRDADRVGIGQIAPEIPSETHVFRLPSHEEIEQDPRKLMEATLALERQNHETQTWAYQTVAGRTVLFAPRAKALETDELDRLYALPFARRAHPSYKKAIPAVEMIQFSMTTHRGCGGGCSFCSLALHQGRRISSRSRRGILTEAERLTGHPAWKGTITDVGGPTANMWGATCAADAFHCSRSSCLWPQRCPNFRVNQGEILQLLGEIRRITGVKSVRVASGVRHDLALQDMDYVKGLVGEFTGGQLKLAPEHACEDVLKLMRKPAFGVFEEFLTVFEHVSRGAGKEQYVIPYLISAFPGTTDEDMRTLATWLRKRGWRPQQVQCFIPTPGTVATAMFYAGIDTEGHAIPVAKTEGERRRQHRILIPDTGRGEGA